VNAAIAVEGLVKSYGPVKAIDGLTFAVGEASMYGLIGPDGAGKTTFMRIAVCLLGQDGGTVVIRGHDTRREAHRIRRIIGYMPQQFSQYVDLTVEENLKFFADLFGIGSRERKRRIGRLLEFSRLGPFVKRPAGKLSGGMKRKLALSCTLIHTPEILFLDEPTTGVDPVSRREFWDILSEVKREGTTVLVSTPYMDEAARCDRVGFVMGGRLIREGDPRKLPETFAAEIVLVRAPDIVRRTRTVTFPGEVSEVMVFGDRLHLTVPDASAAIPIIRRFVEGIGISAPVIERVSPSMEDIFVESMTHAT